MGRGTDGGKIFDDMILVCDRAARLRIVFGAVNTIWEVVDRERIVNLHRDDIYRDVEEELKREDRINQFY